MFCTWVLLMLRKFITKDYDYTGVLVILLEKYFDGFYKNKYFDVLTLLVIVKLTRLFHFR